MDPLSILNAVLTAHTQWQSSTTALKQLICSYHSVYCFDPEFIAHIVLRWGHASSFDNPSTFIFAFNDHGELAYHVCQCTLYKCSIRSGVILKTEPEAKQSVWVETWRWCAFLCERLNTMTEVILNSTALCFRWCIGVIGHLVLVVVVQTTHATHIRIGCYMTCGWINTG